MPELWDRVTVARWLNRMCGCTTFNIYNVDEIPDIDMVKLQTIMNQKENVAEYKAKMANG